jgi:dihydroflavonol-4-reductase
MLILVTGSTGFIGSQIVKALVASGERVRAFHRPDSPLAALEGLEVEHALGDLTQPETLAAAVRGAAVVFHTAAVVGRRRRGDMGAVTVGGTRSLLQAAREAGVRRVVHTSSVAALGVPDHIPGAGSAPGGAASLLMDENHTWNFRPEWWPYGYAKYLAELEVQRAVAQGLEVVITNPSVVVGAGDLNRISGDIILRVAGGQLPVSTAGGLNVVHIDDVVSGHLAALERGRKGERYILGGENLTITQFLNLIAGITGAPPPRLLVPAPVSRLLAGPVTALASRLNLPVGGDLLRMAGANFFCDTRKARQELGLADPKPARQAIAEAYLWYRAQGAVRAGKKKEPPGHGDTKKISK